MTFDTGVHQGSVLSPTLFNVFLNPLLCLLTAIVQQRGISHGIKGIESLNNLTFEDDLSTIAEVRRLGDPIGGAQMLLNAIEEFSNWSGMEVKVVKSCGMWVGANRDEKLLLKLTFRDQQLEDHGKRHRGVVPGFLSVTGRVLEGHGQESNGGNEEGFRQTGTSPTYIR